MRTRSIWKKFVMALVLIAGCLYSKNAAAQNGTCVVNTQQITYQCQSGCTQTGCTCKSSTTVTVPSGGYGNGVLCQTATTQCCGNTVSYITSPDGQCRVEARASVRMAATGENRLVFLRGCDGRFRLYTLAA